MEDKIYYKANRILPEWWEVVQYGYDRPYVMDEYRGKNAKKRAEKCAQNMNSTVD